MLLGLFSKTITSKAVWLTAIPVFVIGLAFNFPLILDKQILKKSPEEFSAFASWVASLGKYPEMIIGVLLPLLILMVLAFASRGTADGWRRIEALVKRNENDSGDLGVVTVYDPVPGYIVSIALAICGLVMLVLACLNADERMTVIVFGVSLVAIGGVIGWSARLKSRRLVAEGYTQL